MDEVFSGYQLILIIHRLKTDLGLRKPYFKISLSGFQVVTPSSNLVSKEFTNITKFDKNGSFEDYTSPSCVNYIYHWINHKNKENISHIDIETEQKNVHENGNVTELNHHHDLDAGSITPPSPLESPTTTSSNQKSIFRYSFFVPLHSVLFDSLHLDLYQKRLFLSDKMIGSIIVKLSDLSSYPMIFTSWFEFNDDKKRPASSFLSGALEMTIERKPDASILPLQYRIAPQFMEKSEQPINNLTLSKHKEESTSTMEHLDSNDGISSSIKAVSEKVEEELFLSSTSVALPMWLFPLKVFLDEQSIEGLLSLYRLICSFGKGLSISNPTLASAFYLLGHYYEKTVPLIYSSIYIKDIEFIDTAKYIFRFSISVYGWRGLNFWGKGKGFLRDPFRSEADKKCILEYLSIPEEDLLELNLYQVKMYNPRYLIVHDKITSSIVISIRGSMTPDDWMTSLACHYIQYKTGYIHSGFFYSGLWMKDFVLKRIIEKAKMMKVGRIILTGHSLGAAVAVVTKLLYLDEMNDRHQYQNGNDDAYSSTTKIEVYAFGCPSVISVDLVEPCRKIEGIHSFVYGNDIAVRASYGAIMDFRPLLSKAASFATVRQLFSGFEEKLEPCLKELDYTRREVQSLSQNPKLYIPGVIYYMYEMVDGYPLHGNNISESRNIDFISKASTTATTPHHYTSVMEIALAESFSEISIRPWMFVHHNPPVYEKALHNISIGLGISDRSNQ